MQVDWDEVGYVISSKYRIAALERLQQGPATPTQIAEDTDMPIAHISRALQTLRERSHIELLVSEDRQKGRVYGVTETGEEVWQVISDQGVV